MLKAFKEGLIQGCVVRPSAVIGPNDFKLSKIGTALLDFQAKKFQFCLQVDIILLM